MCKHLSLIFSFVLLVLYQKNYFLSKVRSPLTSSLCCILSFNPANLLTYISKKLMRFRLYEVNLDLICDGYQSTLKIFYEHYQVFRWSLNVASKLTSLYPSDYGKFLFTNLSIFQLFDFLTSEKLCTPITIPTSYLVKHYLIFDSLVPKFMAVTSVFFYHYTELLLFNITHRVKSVTRWYSKDTDKPPYTKTPTISQLACVHFLIQNLRTQNFVNQASHCITDSISHTMCFVGTNHVIVQKCLNGYFNM